MVGLRQYQIRDLILGESTAYRVTDDSDLFSRSNRSMGGDERAWSDGSWRGAQFRSSFVVSLSLLIDARTTELTLEAIDQLQYAMRPVGFGQDIEFVFNLGLGPRKYYGRPIMCNTELQLLGAGAVTAQLAFEVNDPVTYSADEELIEGITLPIYSGGHIVPHTVPFVVTGTRTGGETTIDYDATHRAYPKLRINGPDKDLYPSATLDNPSVSITSDGRLLRLTVELSLKAGDWLEIDTSSRTVLLNGTANRRTVTYTEPAGEWPSLAPGSNLVRFRGLDNSASSTLDISWLKAWY